MAQDILDKLSTRNTKKNVSLSEISERQNISLPYLEQLFLKLRKAGIVISYRGSSGGYAIAKSPDLLRITEILKAVDQDLDLGSEKGSILNKSKFFFNFVLERILSRVFTP